jgi:hypothetical protein
MRRRAKQGNRIDENPVDFLDEDEQDEITRNSLERCISSIEGNERCIWHHLHHRFNWLSCYFLACCKSYTGQGTCRTGGCIPLRGRANLRTNTNSHHIDAVIAGVSLVPIVLLSGFETGDSDIHWSLSLGNVLTTVGAILSEARKAGDCQLDQGSSRLQVPV